MLCNANSQKLWLGLKQKQRAWYWIRSKTKLSSIFQNIVEGTGSAYQYQNIYPAGNLENEGPNENNIPVYQKTSSFQTISELNILIVFICPD